MVISPRSGFLGTVSGSRTCASLGIVDAAYTPGQVLARHSHERAFISVAIQGAYVEQCGSLPREFRKGDVIFHSRGETHSDRFLDQGGRILNIDILPILMERLRDCGIATSERIESRNPMLLNFGFRILSELGKCDALSDLVIEGLGMELIAEFLRNPTEARSQRTFDWVTTVKEILHESYRDPPSLEKLADQAGVHPVHLARSFRKRFNCSVGEYVRKLRFMAAYQDVLHSKAPLIEVAARHGYADQSHLCRAIKSLTGLSPGEIRRGR